MEVDTNFIGYLGLKKEDKEMTEKLTLFMNRCAAKAKRVSLRNDAKRNLEKKSTYAYMHMC